MTNYNEMLLKEAKNNNLKGVKAALSDGATIVVVDSCWTSHGWNALHWAVFNGNTSMVQEILTSNHNDHHINAQTSSPYCLNLNNKGNETALHIVAKSGANLKIKKEIIKILLHHNALLDIKNARGESCKKLLQLNNILLKTNENKITIRVWKASLEWGQVGHVTIETYGQDGFYASFWPMRDPSKSDPNFSQLRQGIDGFNVPIYSLDVFIESIRNLTPGRLFSKDRNTTKTVANQPDIEVTLYSLDAVSMKKEFKNFINSNTKWSIFGSSFFGASNTSNCSGLASLLLNAGGFQKLVISYASQLRKIFGWGLGAISLLLFGIAVIQQIIEDGKDSLLGASLALPILTLGTALLGKTVGEFIGGFVDGVQDGVEVAFVLNALNRFFPNKINTGIASSVSGVLNGSMSAINHLLVCFPDHTTSNLVCTPGYIARLAEWAEIEEKQAYSFVDLTGIEKSNLDKKLKIL